MKEKEELLYNTEIMHENILTPLYVLQLVVLPPHDDVAKPTILPSPHRD